MPTRPTDNKIRLTLIAIHPERSPQSVPLAAAFLAAAVAKQLPTAVAVTILDLYTDQPAPESIRLIQETRPELVGFSVYLWNRTNCCELSRQLKQTAPQLTLFCGGPEATADRQGLLTAAPWDFLIHGEGEFPLVTALKLLLDGKDVAAAPGTATLRSGELHSTPGEAVSDLDSLPSPLLSGMIDPASYSGMLWQISRGCSFGCEFCFDGGGSRQVRRFSLQRIEAELHWLAASRVSQVFVLDSTFNSDRERAVKILRLIKKIAPDIHFHFEVRSEFLNREQAKLFAAITCSLQIGLQSGSSTVLEGVGRSFKRADFSTAVNLLNATGAVFGFDLIYGLPGDSFAGFQESLDFALALLPNHLDIFPLALLPGTILAQRADELGLRHQLQPPYTLLAAPTFPQAEIAAAARLATACDIFYSRGKAVSWFITVAKALALKPAVLLLGFADYLGAEKVVATGEKELADDRILRLQCGYLSRIFTAKGAKKLLPLALDLVNYNYYYAAALLAVPPPPQNLKGVNPAACKLELAPSARLTTFNYEILELLELESGDLRALAAAISQSGSTAVIYPKNGEVLTESLHESYLQLLQRLNSRRRAGDIAAELGIAAADAADFLQFALEDGIVIITSR